MINPNASYLAPPGPRDLDRKAIDDLASTHAGLKTLADLVSLVSNASKSKDVIAQHVRAAEDARAALAEFDRARDDMAKQMLAHHQTMQQSKSELEAELTRKRAGFTAEHERRSVGLSAKEAQLAKREAAVSKGEQEVAAKYADLQRRLDHLKAAAA
jgi:uncharacterized protein involved in exopolysaccharide biosynthesis